METEHTSRIEARGWALVTSLETSRGFSLTLTAKRSGFNGLSISKLGDDVRKIEVKTVGQSDKWFAVNGLRGIERLFLDKDYWIYFALLPENIVVITHAVPFLQKQVKYENTNAQLTDELKHWLASTKKVSRDFGLRFVPRVHLNIRVPIRKMVKQTLEKPNNAEWHDVVAEIWRSGEKWERDFRSPLEEADDD
ncbi:MAG: hypothetical protein IT330_05860 [Anaerolineae bacterium]|nr:hypothetical protein [Anaerolineae bacterium]